MTFEVLCPIIQVVNLIQQENHCPAVSACFGVGPTTLPKSGKRRVWFVSRRVDCGIAKLGGNFKEQRGLANLARPCEKLDSAGCRFSESFQEEVPTRRVIPSECRHTRIIIRLYLMNVKRLSRALATTHPVFNLRMRSSASFRFHVLRV